MSESLHQEVEAEDIRAEEAEMVPPRLSVAAAGLLLAALLLLGLGEAPFQLRAFPGLHLPMYFTQKTALEVHTQNLVLFFSTYF